MLRMARSCRVSRRAGTKARKAWSAACAVRGARARGGGTCSRLGPRIPALQCDGFLGTPLAGRYSMFPRAVAGCGHGISNCMPEQPGETLTAQVAPKCPCRCQLLKSLRFPGCCCALDKMCYSTAVLICDYGSSRDRNTVGRGKLKDFGGRP